uniref:U23-Lycotoxin-Lsp1e_1 n=1 Tax=Lycosa sp. SGP-2016 TaxID=1905177 RepID=A0A482ZEU4_9ARAC
MKHFAFLFAVAGAFVLVASAPSEEGDEAFPDIIETPRKSCLEIGEVCDGNSNDCQCCRSNGFCSCSWIFNHCTCQVGDSSKSYGVCLWKQKNCPNKPSMCTKPCTNRRRCKNRSG